MRRRGCRVWTGCHHRHEEEEEEEEEMLSG